MMATSIKIKSDSRNLKEIRSFIRKVAEEYGFEKAKIDEIVLAVDEACTNIIRHSYKGDPTKNIIITIEQEKNKLIITLRDFGEKPNLDKIYTPPSEKLRKGGFGVIFIKEMMDEVTYDISPEKGTILRLVKYKR